MTSLPESHPPVESTQGATCPVTGQYSAPPEGASRSPCPALNTMANHGYINRDGKNLSASDVAHGLTKCYNLSGFLSWFLAHGGYLMLGKVGQRLDLYDIGRHNKIEHDASLVHHDTPEGEDYAPIQIDHSLVDKLFEDVKPSAEEVEALRRTPSGADERFLMNFEDVARARIRREKDCHPVTSLRQNIARGEMAIILGVFEVTAGSKSGIPAEWMKRWIGEERMPENWKPTHVVGIFDVIRRNSAIKNAVDKLRAEQEAAKKST